MQTLIKTDWAMQSLGLWLQDLEAHYQALDLTGLLDPHAIGKMWIPEIASILHKYLPAVTFERLEKPSAGTLTVKKTKLTPEKRHLKVGFDTLWRWGCFASHGKDNKLRWIADIRAWEVACLTRALLLSINTYTPLHSTLLDITQNRKTGPLNQSRLYEKLPDLLLRLGEDATKYADTLKKELNTSMQNAGELRKQCEKDIRDNSTSTAEIQSLLAERISLEATMSREETLTAPHRRYIHIVQLLLANFSRTQASLREAQDRSQRNEIELQELRAKNIASGLLIQAKDNELSRASLRNVAKSF